MNTPPSQPKPTEKADPASAISVAQLCDLTGYSPSLISSLKDVLPAPFTVPTASPQGGKPMHMFPLEALAELIIKNTSFLTDAECRLRVALSTTARKRKSPMVRFIDAHSLLEIDGESFVLPCDHSALPPDLAIKVRAAIAEKHADTRAKRCARHQTRKPTTDPQGTQP
jgi:hypothetical protein